MENSGQPLSDISDGPIYFALTSCQKYSETDRADGFHIYESLQRAAPNFFVSCGDNVSRF